MIFMNFSFFLITKFTSLQDKFITISVLSVLALMACNNDPCQGSLDNASCPPLLLRCDVDPIRNNSSIRIDYSQPFSLYAEGVTPQTFQAEPFPASVQFVFPDTGIATDWLTAAVLPPTQDNEIKLLLSKSSQKQLISGEKARIFLRIGNRTGQLANPEDTCIFTTPPTFKPGISQEVPAYFSLLLSELVMVHASDCTVNLEDCPKQSVVYFSSSQLVAGLIFRYATRFSYDAQANEFLLNLDTYLPLSPNIAVVQGKGFAFSPQVFLANRIDDPHLAAFPLPLSKPQIIKPLFTGTEFALPPAPYGDIKGDWGQNRFLLAAQDGIYELMVANSMNTGDGKLETTLLQSTHLSVADATKGRIIMAVPTQNTLQQPSESVFLSNEGQATWLRFGSVSEEQQTQDALLQASLTESLTNPILTEETISPNELEVNLADIDHDNLLDLLVLNTKTHKLFYLPQHYSGHFKSPQQIQGLPANIEKFAAGDIDGNGYTDLVTIAKIPPTNPPNSNLYITLFLNQAGSPQ